MGTIVRSTAGHDTGELFVVIVQEGGYVYLADGKYRKVEKPKRKNKKHVAICKDMAAHKAAATLAAARKQNGKVTNEQVKYVLKHYNLMNGS